MPLGRSIALICAIVATASLAHAQQAVLDPRSDAAGQTVSIEFEPPQPRTGDDLKLKVRVGGSALRAEVQWSVNGEQVTLSDCNEATPEAALGVAVKDGDRVAVVATPFNAENVAGRPVGKNVTIGNSPPHMKLVEQKIAGGVYTAKVEATDPEGEQVSLTLQQGPRGMSLDPNGNITWKFGQGTTGKFDVKVSAKDPLGGEALLSYSFSIRRSGP